MPDYALLLPPSLNCSQKQYETYLHNYASYRLAVAKVANDVMTKVRVSQAKQKANKASVKLRSNPFEEMDKRRAEATRASQKAARKKAKKERKVLREKLETCSNRIALAKKSAQLTTLEVKVVENKSKGAVSTQMSEWVDVTRSNSKSHAAAGTARPERKGPLEGGETPFDVKSARRQGGFLVEKPRIEVQTSAETSEPSGSGGMPPPSPGSSFARKAATLLKVKASTKPRSNN